MSKADIIINITIKIMLVSFIISPPILYNMKKRDSTFSFIAKDFH